MVSFVKIIYYIEDFFQRCWSLMLCAVIKKKGMLWVQDISVAEILKSLFLQIIVECLTAEKQ